MRKFAHWPFLGQGKPIEISHAEGAYLYRKDGTAILDAAGGAIVTNIGHGRADIAAKVAQAATNTSYVVPPWLTPERDALVTELTEHWLPDYLTRIHLTSGGSEANESAIKMAVQYQAARGKPEKCLILARSLSYHGASVTTSGVSGHAARKLGLESLLATFPTIETPYPLRCPAGADPQAQTDYYIQNLRDVIAEVGAGNIAALIAEPMNGSSAGAITPPPGYWQAAQKVLREHDILLILDEVMTGFGRIGTPFGLDFYDIKPDLLVAGKGLAGGYAAIAGVYATEAVAGAIADAGYDVMFHTFAALPHSCAAAVAVLTVLREEGLMADVAAKGEALRARLNDALGQHPHVAEVRGEGLLIGIEIVKNRDTLERYPIDAGVTGKVVQRGLEEGVFFYPGGTGEARDIVCIGAPFIIGDEEMDKITRTLTTAINHATQ